MQARYYDPVIGRFYSNDPVGFRDIHSFNRYAYANNNPYRYTDPDGRSPLAYTPLDTGSGATGAANLTQAERMAGVGVIASVMPGVGDVVGIADAIADPSAINIIAAVVGVVPVVGDAAAVGIKSGKVLSKLPTGKGAVPKSERDPKRFFTPKEREAKRMEQGHQCGNGCGTDIDASNSAGHHIDRHADGGRTGSENHAEVCVECHKKLHAGE